MKTMNHKANILYYIIAAGKILDRQNVPMRGRKAWVNVNGKVVMIDAVQRKRKRKREGQREGQGQMMLGRIDGFNFYKERSPMKFNELTIEVAKQLPGSVGAAQVAQVAKKLFDIMCVYPDPEILTFMTRRRKLLSKRIMKKVGSANCVLPRARKK